MIATVSPCAIDFLKCLRLLQIKSPKDFGKSGVGPLPKQLAQAGVTVGEAAGKFPEFTF